jgi:hypothetical protein
MASTNQERVGDAPVHRDDAIEAARCQLVVLDGRLRQALSRLHPDLPHEALKDAYRKLMRGGAPGHNEDVLV